MREDHPEWLRALFWHITEMNYSEWSCSKHGLHPCWKCADKIAQQRWPGDGWVGMSNHYMNHRL